MLKWMKRVVAVLAVLLVLIVVLAVVGLLLAQSTPDWYRPGQLSEDQRRAAAQSATNKLITLQNETATARADEQAAIRNRREPSSRPAGMTLTLTDDELNALLGNWSVWQSVRSGYEKFLKDPYIVLMDGRVILSGRVKELDAVASVHFEPHIDDQGRLQLTVAKVLAGKLPLPAVTMSSYQKKAADAVMRRLPQWRQRASIDPTGIANDEAVSAVMGEMIMNVLNNEASAPVIFTEVLSKGRVPVKLAGIEIEDHSIKLTVQSMTAPEREELLRNIREPRTPNAAP